MPSSYTITSTVLGATLTEPNDGENRNVASMTAITRPIANGLLFETNARIAADTAEATARAAAVTAEAATRAAAIAVQAARICLFDVSNVALATTFVSTSSSYTDVTGLTLSITSCLPGDLLMIDASMLLTSLDTLSAKVMINDGGSVDPVQVVHAVITEYSSGNTVGAWNGVRSFSYQVVNSGTVTVKVQGKGGGLTWNVLGTASTDSAGSTIRVMRFR